MSFADYLWTLFSRFPSGAVRSFTGYLWLSTSWTARGRPASTRRPSGEIPPGTECPQPLGPLYRAAPPLRAPTACSASRSCSSTRRPFHGAHPSIESCPTAPGRFCCLWPEPLWRKIHTRLENEICLSFLLTRWHFSLNILTKRCKR